MAHLLASIFLLCLSSTSASEGTCSPGDSTCTSRSMPDEASLLQADVRINAQLKDQMQKAQESIVSASGEATSAELDLDAIQTGVQSIVKVISALRHYTEETLKTHNEDLQDTLNTSFTDIVNKTQNFSIHVRNAATGLYPLNDLLPEENRPILKMVVTKTEAAGTGHIPNAVSDANHDLARWFNQSYDTNSFKVNKTLSNVLDRAFTLGELVVMTQKELSKVDEVEAKRMVKEVRSEIGNLEKALAEAEGEMMDFSTTSRDKTAMDINRKFWNVQDAMWLFNHDMEQQKGIAISINLPGPAVQVFDGLKDYLAIIDDMCHELKDKLIDASSQTNQEIIGKTNNALDVAMRTATLLSGVEEKVVYSGAFGRVGLGLPALLLAVLAARLGL